MKMLAVMADQTERLQRVPLEEQQLIPMHGAQVLLLLV